jgi:hypothetical protein
MINRKAILFLTPLLLVAALSGQVNADGERYLLYENFDTLPLTGELPSGWVATDNNGDFETWAGFTLGGGARGGDCTRYLCSEFFTADDWIYSPSVTFSTGVSYTLSFKCRITSSSFPHKLGITLSSSTHAMAIFPNLDISNTDIEEVTASFSLSDSFGGGEYRLGFHCVSATDHLALFLDDVLISVPEPDLQVTCQMDKAFYSSGANTYGPTEEKKCLVLVSNAGSSSTTINDLMTIGDEDDPSAVLSFRVSGPNAQVLDYQGKNKRAIPERKTSTRITAKNPGPKILPPSGSSFKRFDLERGGFGFTLQGVYTIRAVYKNVLTVDDEVMWQGKIVSEPITIIVE